MPLTKTTWLAGMVDPQWTLLCHVERVGMPGEVPPRAGAARAVAWIQVPTQVTDLSHALPEAADRLAQLTGSRYLDERRVLIHISTRGWGCDGLGLCFGALPPPRVLIAALTSPLSLEAARQALHQAAVEEVGSILAQEGASHHHMTDLMHQTRPDLVLLVGGSEGGATQPIKDLARLLIRAMGQLPASQQPRLFYAGNEEVRETLHGQLPAAMGVTWLPNLLPTSRTQRLAPTVAALQDFQQQRLSNLPGYHKLCSTIGSQNCLSPEESARRLLRFWVTTHGLQSVSGAWWIGSRLMVLQTHNGGHAVQCNWNDGAQWTIPVPRPVAQRTVAAAVWAGSDRPAGIGNALRQIAQGRSRAHEQEARLWVDQEGLSLALTALAAQAGEPGAEALLLDGLVAA